jgi:hypothetical protein
MSDNKTTAWIINGLLAVIFVLLAGYYVKSTAPAYAAGWDTDGIMAAQALDTDRLVLVDTKNRNICMYATTGNAFRLVGARSYEYDTEVEDSAGTVIERGQGCTWGDMKLLYDKKKP